MSLLDYIYKKIKVERGLTVSEYMRIALSDPKEGYYMTKAPFGLEGDFVTAPELSQIFGEMLGVWLAECWQMLGKPKSDLVELGPGKGTLMDDLLRATKHVEGFHEAMSVTMVETSDSLQEQQKKLLEGKHPNIQWRKYLPEGEKPLFVLGNEFFDALPIDQYVVGKKGFHMRLVMGDRNSGLHFDQTDGAYKSLPTEFPQVKAEDFPTGAIVEICPEAQQIMEQVSQRIVRHGGAGLFIDYGYTRLGDMLGYTAGDTLQAVKSHQYHAVLDAPGEADLTAHVDFTTLADVAMSVGGYVPPVLSQGAFLQRMGGELRLQQLCKNAQSDILCDKLMQGYRRLVHEEEMGELFKVLAVMPAGIPAPLFTEVQKEGK